MTARFVEILRRLAAHDVEFVVVGMTAGVLQGAPLTTLDLDIVHRRTPENVARLLRALRELEAVYRHDPRMLCPQESHLASPGHQLLSTAHGDLDCLGTIEGERGYEELAATAVRMQLGEGQVFLVQDLASLIDVKQRVGRAKDLAAIPVLRATLAESKRRS